MCGKVTVVDRVGVPIGWNELAEDCLTRSADFEASFTVDDFPNIAKPAHSTAAQFSQTAVSETQRTARVKNASNLLKHYCPFDVKAAGDQRNPTYSATANADAPELRLATGPLPYCPKRKMVTDVKGQLLQHLRGKNPIYKE